MYQPALVSVRILILIIFNKVSNLNCISKSYVLFLFEIQNHFSR